MDKTDDLEIHYADEEGDPYAVELAGRVGGFVVGHDSDFVIFNPEGYLGYVPLEDMVWNVSQDVSADDGAQNVEDDDWEFQTVRKAKGKKIPLRLAKGLIPPNVKSSLSLSLIVYKPCDLATNLKLPVTLLPLLGALVGNDFSIQPLSSQRSTQSLFFPRKLTSPQRINHVAVTLNSILSASSQKRKPKYQVGSVMDLIDKAVDALLLHTQPTIGSGEVENIVSSVVDATLQYAIPRYDGEPQGPSGLWPTQVCALHDPDVCPLLPPFSRSLLSNGYTKSEEWAMRDEVRALCVGAYRTGRLSPKIMHILSTGTYWPRLFLENPDLEAVSRSIGRPVRQWGYAILEDGIGLPRKSDEQNENEEDHPIDDENELVDVVEEDSETDSIEDDGDGDPLAFLRGELDRLRKPADGGVPDPPRSVSSSQPSRIPAKTIIEYVRRGTRIAGEEVTVPFLADLLDSLSIPEFDSQSHIPLQLRSEEDRLTVLLHVLGSNTPSLKSLPPEQLMVALALRWVVRVVGDRARDSQGVKEREKERWTKTEARAFLGSFPWIAVSDQPTKDTTSSTEDLPPIIDRNIQLMAQALMALEFSGKLFHAFLTGNKIPVSDGIPENLWEACAEGLEDAFGEEWRKKVRKGAKIKATALVNPTDGYSQKDASSKSLFRLLGDMEV